MSEQLKASPEGAGTRGGKPPKEIRLYVKLPEEEVMKLMKVKVLKRVPIYVLLAELVRRAGEEELMRIAEEVRGDG